MSFDLAHIKAANPIADVVGRTLDLKRSGREFVALCPFHGEKTPSFTVTPEKGFFKCFGCGVQGDVIDFTRRMHGVDLRRACEMLGAQEEPILTSKAPAAARVTAEVYQPVMPVPGTAPPPPAGHPKLGAPDHIAHVRDQDGALLHLIYRWEASDSTPKKTIRPLSFDGTTWQWKGPPKPRPLYGLPLTGQPILLVEGEKKRDIASAILSDDYDVVSWANGAEGVQHAAWGQLHGHDVVLWPDADQPGADAAHDVAAALRGIATSFRVVSAPPAVPAGWDVADAIGEGQARATLLALITMAETPLDPSTVPPEPDPEDPGPQPQDEPSRQSRRQDGDRPIEWPEPLNLFANDDTGLPVIGPEHIPAALWPFVIDTAERMGVEPASVALIALATCSSVVNDAWKIQPKRKDWSWTEQARFWALIVGDPSILKSPVISICTAPVIKLEMDARRRHAEAMTIYKRELAAFKADKNNQVPEPKLPKLDRYMVEGTTVEALSDILRTDEEAKMRAPASKVLVRQDEMSEFFAGLDRYKSGGKGGGDRGAYLRLFNGGAYVVDRVARGNMFVQNWSASFVGGVQPDPIRNIAGEAAEDGLLQRFNYCVPLRQGRGLDRAPSKEAKDRYEALFPAMSGLYPPSQIGSNLISAVVLHADGHQHREDIDALARAVSSLPDTSKQMKAALGKWPGLFARLTLIFHMVNMADDMHSLTGSRLVVPPSTTEMVGRYMQDILLPHLLRAEAVMYSTKQTGRARDIAGLILAKDYKRVTIRDVQRGYPALRDPGLARDVTAVMDSLVSIGWLEPEVPNNPVKPVHSWQVNPKVHEIFATRRSRELATRERERADAADDIERYRRMQTARKDAKNAA